MNGGTDKSITAHHAICTSGLKPVPICHLGVNLKLHHTRNSIHVLYKDRFFNSDIKIKVICEHPFSALEVKTTGMSLTFTSNHLASKNKEG